MAGDTGCEQHRQAHPEVGQGAHQETEKGVKQVFSPPRLTSMAADLGLGPGFALDLHAQRPDGKSWDLSLDSNIRDASRLIREGRPYLVLGSLPYGPYSKVEDWQSLLGSSRTKAKALLRAVE